LGVTSTTRALAAILCLALSVVLVSGWMRGGHEAKTRASFVLFSRLGFVAGTWSGLVVVVATTSNRLEGIFQYHDPKPSRFYVIGALFAALGVVLSMFGL
jgi:hypothetical protein